MATKKSSNSLDGWIDESVPGEPPHPLFVIDSLFVGTTLPAPPPTTTQTPLRALLKRHGVDADPFIEWLGPKLGEYRDEMRLRKQMPTPAEEREFLLDLSHRASELCRLLNDLPPRTLVALRPGREHVPDLKRLSDDLLLLDHLCRHGEAVFRASPGRPGRKGAAPRNDLLRAIVKQLKAEKLTLGKTETRDLAAQILELCKIDVAADERSLRRAVRPGGRK